LPRGQKIIDSRKQALLRRIPRLFQIVIEMRFVDGSYCGLDI
jgi:hypothetical protein